MSEGLPVSESFIIALFGGISGIVMLILSCGLKSRCVRIKCGCWECDRDVLEPQHFASVDVSRRSVN